MNDHLERARLLFANGRYEGCVDELRSALREEPDRGYAHSLLSLSLQHLGQKDAALVEAEDGVRLDPESAYAHYTLASALNNLGRRQDGEAQARVAVSLEPEDADFLGYLASLQIENGKPSEGLETAAFGLAFSPDHAVCILARATALLKLGQVSESIESTRQMLALYPDDPDAHSLLGRALERAKDNQLAKEHYVAALRLDPNRIIAFQGLVRTHRSRSLFHRIGGSLLDLLTYVPPWVATAELFIAWVGVHATPRLVRAFHAERTLILCAVVAYILVSLLLRIVVLCEDRLSPIKPPAAAGSAGTNAGRRWGLLDLAYFASLAAVPLGIAWHPGFAASLTIDVAIIVAAAGTLTARPGENALLSLIRINPVAGILVLIGCALIAGLHG